MNVKNLSMSFGTQELFNDVNIQIDENEKVGVVGLNGAGKTTLFKIMLGKEQADAGKIVFNNNARVEWLPQVIEDDISSDEITTLEYLLSARPIEKLSKKLQICYESLSINMSEQEQNKIYNQIDKLQKKLNYWDQYNAENTLLKIIDGMKLESELLDKKIRELSGGQKSKVAFAKLLYSNPEVMLLDEPTNHLDPTTQQIIAETFKDYKGTMLVVSHNPEFVDNLGVERTLVMPTGNVSYYDRDYVEYYSNLNDKSNVKKRKC